MGRVLFVITGLGVGGAEKVVTGLADKASYEGSCVKLVYLTGEAKVKPSRSDIEIISLNMKNNFSFFKALVSLVRVIRSFKPNVIHSHMFHANILTRLTRFFVKIPRIVCSSHNSKERGIVKMLTYRLTNPLCDVMTNVSREACRKLEKAGFAKSGTMKPVLNGIDVDYFKPDKRDHGVFTIIAVGRLEEQKDYPTLIRAIKELVSIGCDFKVRIVGDGKQRQSLMELTESLGVSQYFEWLGIRNDIPALLNEADVFVLSSQSEGFGLVVAEAMACALPVVATDCGGVAEVAGNKEWLVKPGDYSALAVKVSEIMKMPDAEKQRIGELNRKRIINNFSADNMYEKYKSLY